jgi:hypothetical protein
MQSESRIGAVAVGPEDELTYGVTEPCGGTYSGLSG